VDGSELSGHSGGAGIFMKRKSILFRGLAATAIAALVTATSAEACTGLMLRNSDGTVSHGRTVEFGIPLQFDLAVVPRNYKFTGQTPIGAGKTWSSKYGAVGMIVFGNLGIMDGINEKGLAVGAFYFPTEAEYTKTTPENQAQSMSAVDFSNWVLTSFATVDEARAAIESGQGIVAPTLLPGWPPTVQPFHWIVYDKSGKSIVIEPLGGKLVIRDNPIGVLTNSPTFDWHMTNLRNYIALKPRDVPQVKVDGTTFQAFGMGNGMFGLPGDFTPPSRFVRAAVFSVTAKPAANATAGVFSGFHLLNNFDIPVGAVRAGDGKVTETDQTLMTVMRDPQGLRYYYKTYADQTVRMVDLNKFDLDAKEVKKVSAKGEQTVLDMSGMLQTRQAAAESR
jgi:choloylglycine hydrolase